MPLPDRIARVSTASAFERYTVPEGDAWRLWTHGRDLRNKQLRLTLQDPAQPFGAYTPAGGLEGVRRWLVHDMGKARGDVIAAGMVGYRLTLGPRHFTGRALPRARLLVFGDVTAALFVPATATNPDDVTDFRTLIDSWTLDVTERVPAENDTITETDPNNAQYRWSVQDEAILTRPVTADSFDMWVHVVSEAASDVLVLQVGEAELTDQRIDLVIRFRTNPRLKPYSEMTIDGQDYQVLVIRNDRNAPRGRWQFATLRRLQVGPE